MRERHNPGTDSLALIPLCKMSNLVTLALRGRQCDPRAQSGVTAKECSLYHQLGPQSQPLLRTLLVST